MNEVKRMLNEMKLALSLRSAPLRFTLNTSLASLRSDSFLPIELIRSRYARFACFAEFLVSLRSTLHNFITLRSACFIQSPRFVH